MVNGLFHIEWQGGFAAAVHQSKIKPQGLARISHTNHPWSTRLTGRLASRTFPNFESHQAVVELVGPRVDDWILIEEVHGGHDAVLKFLLGDTDMAQHRAGELGEEAFDQVEPGAMLGCEG